MKTTVNFSTFCGSFSESRQSTFSYEGKRALFDYLEALEDDTGDEIELDTVALCCEYSEYDTALEAAEQYGFVPERPLTECPRCEGTGELNDDEDEEGNCPECPVCSGSGEVEEDDDECEVEVNLQALAWLEEQTTVIRLGIGTICGVIIANF